MARNIKQIAKNISRGKSNTHQALWIVMGTLSSMSVGIISSAILARYFSKTDYGTYRQIIYVYTTLLIIFTAGLPDVFGYFLPRFSISEGKSIVWKITKVLFLGGAVFSIVLFVFSHLISRLLNNPGLSYGLKVFSPIPFLLLPTLGLEGIFSTYKQTIFIGIYNTITRILTLVFIVTPVVLFKGTYIDAIYGWLIVSFISLLIAFYFKRIPFKRVQTIKSSLKYKDIFAYSLPLVTAAIWGIAIRSSDQFYISHFFGPEIFAVFSNGFVQLPFVSMITSATSIVLMPVFSKILHQTTERTELLSIWRSALFKSAIVIYPIVVFCVFFANDIILILFSKSYVSSIVFFRINMMVNFFNIIVFSPLLLAMGRTRLYARIHMFFAIAVWGFEYLAILIFDSPIAVAIVSVALSICTIVVCMVCVSRILTVGITKLIPYNLIVRIICHSLIVAISLKLALNLFEINSPIAEFLCAFVAFYIVLLSTSRYININYLIVIKPLTKKYEIILVINDKVKRILSNVFNYD